MRITHLRIQNYRGLRNIDIPMSNFGCLIGENNAGKSSVLQAVALFFSGTKLAPHNYFDPNVQVRVEMSFEEIEGHDLARIQSEEHRARLGLEISGGKLTLARIYDSDGKSSMKVVKLTPADSRFGTTEISELLKGLRAGANLMGAVSAAFPELSDRLTAETNQAAARTLIEGLAETLPDDMKRVSDVDLPTGFDKTILPLLPEPIYIPAVKDLADDVKTTESASFGKLLGILFQAIEEQLGDVRQLFERLHGQLNKVAQPDGEVIDGRLDEVKLIELTVQRYLQESFPAVSLSFSIPPPKLQTVLSSAQIIADDGMEGAIETKGDGLKRSVTFSILRAYVELKKSGLLRTEEAGGDYTGRYLLLFEEPELYLYPKAQQLLFDALGTFAQSHSVLLTTHSPLFFGPQATATFTKLAKCRDGGVSPKPFTKAHPVDLRDLNVKDQFQLICHENNNIAFFSDTVVLVEGDSDMVLFPHIARTLDASWDCAKTPVALARIGGKGSIRRYKQFFSYFNMRVALIADLDLLVKGFEHLDVPDVVKEAHADLIRRVDEHLSNIDNIATPGSAPEPSGTNVAEAQRSGSLRDAWRRARKARTEFDNGSGTWEDLTSAVNEFFSWERHDARLEALQYTAHPELVRLKRALLAQLRSHDIFVLERGDIESYYPAGVVGRDKPSKAQHFCSIHSSREEMLALSPELDVESLEHPQTEFEVIFSAIFGSR